MGGILRKPWKMGPPQVCMYVACQSFLPSAFLALGIHHQIFPKQSGGSPRSVWTPVCVRARVSVHMCTHACLCVYAWCASMRACIGKQVGMGAEARGIFVFAPHPQSLQRLHKKMKLPGLLIRTPCCALFRDFFNSLSFH